MQTTTNRTNNPAQHGHDVAHMLTGPGLASVPASSAANAGSAPPVKLSKGQQRAAALDARRLQVLPVKDAERLDLAECRAVFFAYSLAGVLYGAGFSGTKARPDFHYKFISTEARDKYRAIWLEQLKAREDDRQARGMAAGETVNPFKVGDVLVSSWGYEQTNVDFYQVEAVTPCGVTVRKLLAENIEHSGDRGTCVPLVGQFNPSAKPVRARVKGLPGSDPHIRINHGLATVWNGKPQRWTSYA